MQNKAILGEHEIQAILQAATREAKANNWHVAVAIVDDGGHLLGFSRLDGCAPIAAHIAVDKAKAAALGRRETKGYEDMINEGRTAFVSAPLQGLLEGGVPVVVAGQVVGAVGVSGLAKELDAKLAKLAVAAIA